MMIHPEELHSDDERIFCDYCHRPVNAEEDSVSVNGSKFHYECWKQKNNFQEELNFD